MSYAIIRNANYKMGQLPYIYRHNERKNTNYSNKDITKNNSNKNYSIKKVNTSYQKAFNTIKEQYKLKGQIKKVSNVMCELIITSDKSFFETIGEQETKRYFELAYKFVAEYNNLGEEFIISAKVHNDESTPHLHIVYIPVVHTVDKKGKKINKIACSEFWKGKDSYRILQDKFYNYVTDNGFELERGNTKNNEHIPIEKLKKITNYDVQEIAKNSECLELGKITTDNAFMKNDYKRIVNKFNTLAKRYTKVKNIVDNTIYKTEQLEIENYNLKQENQKLKKEVTFLRNYLDKTFEYVSLLFDFSKDRLKRLINSFINNIHNEKYK